MMFALATVFLVTFIVAFACGYTAGYADQEWRHGKYSSGDVEMFSFGAVDGEEYERMRKGAHFEGEV